MRLDVRTGLEKLSVALPLRTIFLAFLVLAACRRGEAQERGLLDTYAPPVGTSESSLSANTLQERARQQRELTERMSLGAPLEGALDPDVYTIGPNDLFSVSVGGVEPIQALVPVSSDGVLVITGLDRIRVAGKTLAEAQQAIEQVLRANFRNVPINVALAQPRAFFVHITGAVPEPKRYLAQPVSRVSDVLEQAFLLEEVRRPVSNGTFRPALRNVQVVHRDSSEDLVDLVAYYRAGQLDQNPYLKDGDAVHVPAFRPSQSAVFVDGEIPFSGAYDVRPDETVLSLLKVGAGTTEVSSIPTVRLTRRQPDGSLETRMLRVADLLAGADEPVQALDNLHVPHPDELTGSATAEGAVRFPGTYPLEEGKTTLRDLLEMAGGFRADALVHGSYLVRDDPTDMRGNGKGTTERPMAQFLLLTDTSAVNQDIRLASLDFFGRNHLAMELLGQNRMSVDVRASLLPDAPPFYVPDGARLVVPRDERMVRVLGQVVRPGGITFQGPQASDYVAAAGGRGPRARGTYVLKVGTGQWLPAKKASVESGDVIFVARKGDLPSNQELARLLLQREDVRLRTYQVAFTAVSAITAIVTTSLFIRRELKN